MTKTTPITEFKGRYFWLSNFYPHRMIVESFGEPWEFLTLEHAYQAMKTLDLSEREHIWVAETPKIAKDRGRKAKLRSNWDWLKIQIMTDLLKIKFSWDSDLAARLIATDNRGLIEGNDWGDQFWGESPLGRGNGRNELGKALSLRRWELTQGDRH